MRYLVYPRAVSPLFAEPLAAVLAHRRAFRARLSRARSPARPRRGRTFRCGRTTRRSPASTRSTFLSAVDLRPLDAPRARRRGDATACCCRSRSEGRLARHTRCGCMVSLSLWRYAYAVLRHVARGTPQSSRRRDRVDEPVRRVSLALASHFLFFALAAFLRTTPLLGDGLAAPLRWYLRLRSCCCCFPRLRRSWASRGSLPRGLESPTTSPP